MEKQFIPYEQALELKELGFKEECAAHYLDENDLELKWKIYRNLSINTNNCIQAPTFSQAFRWLLKHHNLYGVIIPTETMNWTFKTMTVVEGIVEVPPYKHVDSNDYGTPEEAEFACLIKLIEIVKNK